MHQTSYYETIAGLENGSLDIGLIGETDHLSGLTFHPVCKITDVFVSTGQYLNTLSLQTSVTDLECITQGTLLLLDKNNITRQHIDRYLSDHQIFIEHILEVSTMDLLIDFAKTGLGIACVIKEFVEKELEEGSLVLLPAKEPIPSRQVGYAFSPKAPLTRSMERFLGGISANDD